MRALVLVENHSGSDDGAVERFRSNTSVYRGRGIDQNGDAIKGTRVEPQSLTSGQSMMRRTDSAGQYELSGLSSGGYRIVVGSRGFATAARNTPVQSSVLLTVNFLLIPEDIKTIVTGTAGKGSERLAVETPQPITVTDSLEIEERRPSSTMPAIERAPNLTMIGSNPAATRPRLRGLASNRVLVILVDERLTNMRSDLLIGHHAQRG